MGSRTSANSIWNNNKNPGPGTYVPKDVTLTSPKFSMKGKSKMGTNFVANSDGSHEKVPANAIDDKVPGPGTYSASHTQIYSNVSAKFGSEMRPSAAAKDAGA